MFTVGTDTEFFLQTAAGEFVSAIRYIKGGKYDPVKLASGGGVTYDNVAMEFATPVTHDEDGFVAAIRSTLKESLEHLPEGVSVNTRSSGNFPESELQHEEAKRFGCDPDFDAWALAVNEPPPDAVFKPFRTVGGHLHVGYVPESGNDFLLEPMGKVDTVKAFDAIIGVPMTMLDHGVDAVNRRQLYGKAGCHRPTDYGVEYRSLSNYWTLSPNLVRMVYSLASEALRMIRENKIGEVIHRMDPVEIQRIINEGDHVAARKMWDEVISLNLSEQAVQRMNTALSMSGEFDLRKEWDI